MIDTLKLAKENLSVILNNSDLTAIRLLLSICSLLWAGMWLFHMVCPKSFLADSYTSYITMTHLLHPLIWASLFLVHFVTSIFGTLLKRPEVLFLIFDSILGTALWTAMTSMMLATFVMANQAPPAMIVAQITMTMFSWWTLVRTTYGN